MNENINTKICPFCGAEIKVDAKKCRFCGEWITPKDSLQDNMHSDSDVVSNTEKIEKKNHASQLKVSPEPQKSNTRVVYIAIAVLLCISGLLFWHPWDPESKGISSASSYEEQAQKYENELADKYDTSLEFVLSYPDGKRHCTYFNLDGTLYYHDLKTDETKTVPFYGNDELGLEVVSFVAPYEDYLVIFGSAPLDDTNETVYLYDTVEKTGSFIISTHEEIAYYYGVLLTQNYTYNKNGEINTKDFYDSYVRFYDIFGNRLSPLEYHGFIGSDPGEGLFYYHPDEESVICCLYRTSDGPKSAFVFFGDFDGKKMVLEDGDQSGDSESITLIKSSNKLEGYLESAGTRIKINLYR